MLILKISYKESW